MVEKEVRQLFKSLWSQRSNLWVRRPKSYLLADHATVINATDCYTVFIHLQGCEEEVLHGDNLVKPKSPHSRGYWSPEAVELFKGLTDDDRQLVGYLVDQDAEILQQVSSVERLDVSSYKLTL